MNYENTSSCLCAFVVKVFEVNQSTYKEKGPSS
jgi:hypothetical protein